MPLYHADHTAEICTVHGTEDIFFKNILHQYANIYILPWKN